jgi:L-cysteine desulfidase
MSDSFNIKQGVRQGGVLSTFLYQIYNNTLLKDLQKDNLGFSIGNTYVGCPTCADDIALLSDDSNELQCMLSTLHRHSMQDRVSIHPTKTKAVILNKTRAITKSTLKWTLGESEICPTNQAVHLGIIRSEMKENEINIEYRISLAIRTMYALKNTCLHAPWHQWN